MLDIVKAIVQRAYKACNEYILFKFPSSEFIKALNDGYVVALIVYKVYLVAQEHQYYKISKTYSPV